MTKVKICGIRTLEDIKMVNIAHPDFIGFVFAKSKREVTIEQGAKLSQGLSKGIKKVGVFVNKPYHFIKEAIEKCSLDILQFHGEETFSFIEQFNLETWKAFRVRETPDVSLISQYKVDGILLDTYDHGKYGGSGKTFDWNLGKSILTSAKIIVAGGLTPMNVSHAIGCFEPYAVDVSSGVEVNDVKDLRLIIEFIKIVRDMNE
jgi:phosphoribosylanthranilate isomerase